MKKKLFSSWLVSLRGCLKSTVLCYIEPVEIFQITDNQYRFQQAQPNKQKHIMLFRQPLYYDILITK